MSAGRASQGAGPFEIIRPKILHSRPDEASVQNAKCAPFFRQPMPSVKQRQVNVRWAPFSFAQVTLSMVSLSRQLGEVVRRWRRGAEDVSPRLAAATHACHLALRSSATVAVAWCSRRDISSYVLNFLPTRVIFFKFRDGWSKYSFHCPLLVRNANMLQLDRTL